MHITCPKCASSYQVDPSSLSPAGGSVHCARCGHRRFAANTAAITAIEQAYRAEIAVFSGTLASRSTGTEVVEVIKTSVAARERAEAPENGTSGEELTIIRTAPGEGSPGAAIGHHPLPAVQAVIPNSAGAATANRGPGAPQPAFHARKGARPAAVYRKRSDRRQGRWTSIGAGAVIPSLIAANLGLIGWRADLVRLFPPTASLYAAIGLPVNVRGVAFTEFSARTDRQETGAALVIDGRLRNVTERAVRLPQLRFSLRDGKGREVYEWTEPAPKGSLAPGEVLAFDSRLASPPGRGKEVVVRFLKSEETYSAMGRFPLNAVAAVR